MASNNKKKLEPVAPAANKQEALAKALGLIEKQYGKGAVMRLGENTGMAVDHISTGSIGLDCALGIGGLPRGRIVEIMDRNRPVRPRLPCTPSRRHRRQAVRRHSSTPSTHLTRFMPVRWALTSTACWYPSRIPVSRVWKLPRHWCARVHWTSWSWTRSQRSYPVRRSRAKWATRLSACMPA